MIINFDLESLIRQNFTHNPTNEQLSVIRQWADFLLSREDMEAFLLRGYAGTGKTSLVGALVRSLRALHQQVLLLAPTGRAARVFSGYAETPAFTIHRKIYRQKSMDVESFQVNVNLHKHTLFIVDEASMIANEGFSGALFGTGRLLDDLVQYVYSSEGCRLLLVGDTAQLPPVGEEMSPAMMPEVLEGYGLNVQVAELCEVVRQVEDSGILYNATRIRRLLEQQRLSAFPRMKLAGFPDIVAIPGSELIEALEQSYYDAGMDGTIVVTRSNKRANLFNQGIRGRILDYEDELCSSDRLIVAKNNYYWLRDEETPASSSWWATGTRTNKGDAESFIANGDIAVVRRYRNLREFYGFRFADATLYFPDRDDMELEATLLLDTLQSEAPALTRQQQEQLFQAVWEDYPEITDKRARMKRLKDDIYYNALQVKYGYAVTCHKAQGGQWERVFIDQGYVTADMLSPDYFRWLYTALTRATERVYLINWPDSQVEDEP